MSLLGFLGGASLQGSLQGTGVHKYDTGLFRAQRSVVRQAVGDMLQPLLLPGLGGGAGGYLRAIKMLPRPIRSDSEDELGWIGNAVQGQAPCLVIAVGRKTYDPAGMDIPAIEYVGELELVVYAVGTVSRAFVEGRLSSDAVGTSSSNADPGVETILEHVEELLLGQEPGIRSIHEFRPQHEDEVFTGGEETVWAQHYTVKVERALNPDRLVSRGLVTSIEAKTSINDGVDPPTGTVVDTVSNLGVAP